MQTYLQAMYHIPWGIIRIITFSCCINATMAMDVTVYSSVFHSAILPCETDGKPFLSGTQRVFWYKNEIPSEPNLIYLYQIQGNTLRNGPAYVAHKYLYDNKTHLLTINDVDYMDSMNYLCRTEGDRLADMDGLVIKVVVLVPPSQPMIIVSTFYEEEQKSIQCYVSSVNPGGESIQFTVSVGSDFSVRSTGSDLTERSANTTTGAVSVTYTSEITLQRKHNGKEAKCEVAWRGVENIVTSEGEAVEVQFSADSITMTQSPTGLVANDTLMTFKCLTDEANPTATVTWTVDDDSKNPTSNSTVDDGIYNALKRRSVLTLAAEKSLHNKKVICAIKEKPEVKAVNTLNIAYVNPPLTLSGSPDSDVAVSEGTLVTFTCSLDVNPTPCYSIWTRDNENEKKLDDMTGNYSTLSLQRQHNRVFLFARADGDFIGYPILSSKDKYYIVQFSASSITMTRSPTGAVTENTNVTFTCVTDEAEPTAEVVWTFAGSSRSSTNDSTEDGMYNTQKRISELRLTVDRTLNNKWVKCHVRGNSSIRATRRQNITYPPSVSIQKSSDPIEESLNFTITCNIEVGNPREITAQSWEFEPKYPGSQSQVLPEQRENRELVIESAVYTDAGIYTFTAGNTMGSDEDETQITVHYSPKLKDIEEELVFYSGLNQTVSLHLTVRALPEFSDINSTFLWTRGTSSDYLTRVKSVKLEEEVFQSVLVINSVEEEDYENYTVSVANGIRGPVNFVLELKERGPPETPRNVSVVAVAAQKVNISWVSGLNGGFEQKFTVEIKNVVSRYDRLNATQYVDPPPGKTLHFEITNLTPETEYRVRVISMNDFNGSSERSSDYITVVTRAELVIDNAGTSATLTTRSTVILHWQYVIPDGGKITMIVQQCQTTDNCIEHDVTDYTNRTLEVAVSDGDIFYLVIYQDGLESYKSPPLNLLPFEPSKTPMSDDKPNSSAVIGAVCAVIAVILVVVIVVVVFLIIRRRKQQSNKGSTDEHQESPYEDTGIPLVPKKSEKQKTEPHHSGGDGQSNELLAVIPSNAKTTALPPLVTRGLKDKSQKENSDGLSDPPIPKKPPVPPIGRNGTENKGSTIITAETSAPPVPKKNLELPQKDKTGSTNDQKTSSRKQDYDNMKINDGKRIPQGEFGGHFSKMVAEAKFKREFGELPATPLHPWTVAAVPELKLKNRFKNMLPYDNNRIFLSETGGNPLSAYINASYIKGYNGNVSYIATIGCTKESINDFWRMIWEQNVSIIVMITNLKEKGKDKCALYWPPKDTMHCDEINVKFEKINIYPDYEIKHFKMEKNGECRPVLHYHYTGWPDHGVPQTAAAILKVRDHVKQHRTEGKEPIVVHCSAGVGRTGTFISIDYLLDQVEVEGAVDVFNCVLKLRQQRFNMIQTVEQYRFVYQVMNEAIAVGSTALPCSELGGTLFSLIAEGRLEKQYQVLQTTKPVQNPDDVEFATLFGNDRKNRNPDILPADENRVVLNSFHEDYINAVFVNGYKTPRQYIATQVPMDISKSTFWRMMMDERCAGIVCLQDDPEPLQWFPNENDSMLCGPFLVTNSGRKRKNGILISAVTVGVAPDDGGTYANVATKSHLLPWDEDDKHNLKIFHTGDWVEKPVRKRKISMLRNVYSELQQCQQQSDNKRIIVMCLNGADECGLFIAASSLFDMANTEQEVDIFNLVKQIRAPRPQFICSEEQYIFLHEAVQEYISQFGTYANFS